MVQNACCKAQGAGLSKPLPPFPPCQASETLDTISEPSKTTLVHSWGHKGAGEP